MTVKHVHLTDRDRKLLLDLNRSCLQQLRAMRAEARDAGGAVIFRAGDGPDQ